MALSVGTRLGSYEIVSVLGAGGMGVVYRAFDTRLQRHVALKILASVPDAEARTRLLREARAASGLSHPNICVVHEVGEADGRAFLVLEYVAGQPLSTIIPRTGLPLETVARHGIDIADALAHAHDRGIVHRDLKSANVMIVDGRVKVLDFGLAAPVAPWMPDSLAQTATVAEMSGIGGTVAYMAPEILQGGAADPRGDIWALGVLLHEMAAGERPFGGDTAFALTSAVLRDAPRPLPAHVPAPLAAAIDRCLAKDPARRYQRAGEVRAALEAVQQMATRRRRGPARRPAPATRTARPPAIRSLAVLPLDNLSSDPEQEYFVDGMTEALIANLAKIGALRVISRTSVMRYKGARKPLPEIARELNVDAVVEGSAIRSGDRVRITAQLIHAPTDSHLWAESYDRNFTDVLALQADVARAIAEEIRIKVTPQERARLVSVRPVNPDAYALYLKGRYCWNRMDSAQFRRSIEYFEQARALDPDYAPPYAGVADFYNVLAALGWARPHDVVPKAKAAARRAIELDDSAAEAHAALGYSAIFYDWDWVAAERELTRAIELNPGYAMAHQYYAWYLSTHGRLAEALAENERACALDPLSIVHNSCVAQQYYFARDYDRAVVRLQRTLDLDPNSSGVHWFFAFVYLEQQRFDEAIGELQRAMALMGSDEYQPWLAYAYALAGRRDEARTTLDRLVEKSTTSYVPAHDIARIYVGLGDADHAFEWLDKACDERCGWISYLPIDPPMDPIRSDPRFTQLLQRIGLAPVAVPGIRAVPLRRKTVGRESERAQLRDAFEAARARGGLLVGVAGEPGLGKTTLVDEFLGELSARADAPTVARGRCSERLAGTDAYLPILEALDGLLHGDDRDGFVSMLRSIAPTWYAQVVPLASDDSSAARLLADVKNASQERLKREFTALVTALARRRPLVLFLDDIHWADVSTIDLLAYAAGRFDAVRALIVATYRPSDLALARHPFAALKLDLEGRGLAREIALAFLSRDDVVQYLALQCPGHRFPAELAGLVHARTEGNALFIVDLVRYLRDRGVLVETDGAWTMRQALAEVERELPASVRSVIQRKLDRLPDDDRRLLGAASVQGPDFDSAIVAQALGREATEAEERLDQLERLHGLVRHTGEHALPDGTINVRYRFVHVLYQNALHEALAPSRRASLSGAVAEALLRHAAGRTADIASTLALLFEAARDGDQAVRFFALAAEHAAALSASHEVVALARRGLALLEKLPASADRTRRELGLLLSLGPALTALDGWSAPDVEHTYARARDLCEGAADTPEVFQALWGFSSLYYVRAEFHTARNIGERLLSLANRLGGAELRLYAHFGFGATLFNLGELVTSRAHLEECIGLYDPHQHRELALQYSEDAGSGARGYLGFLLTLLGYVEQGSRATDESLALARGLLLPFNLVYALTCAMMSHLFRRDFFHVQLCAEETIALTERHGFMMLNPYARFFRGRALAGLGRAEEGIAQMRTALRDLYGSGAVGVHRTDSFAALADACGLAGQLDEAFDAIENALRAVEQHSERYFEAEIYRIKGELLLARNPADAAEPARCFLHAMDVARRQQAKLLELRAAVSLGRLWRTQGRAAEAHDLVAGVYGWFTEGFDSADLLAARAFLDESVDARSG